ncbi:MAG: transcription antitermination factor NusB [Planctomycetota bacterium]
MSTRRRAREVVLQLLYEADLNEPRSAELARKFFLSRMQGRNALTDFAFRLFQGVIAERYQIDQQLGQLANRWSVSRMPVVDRNILRLGAFEIVHSETPPTVAINEAVILAKRYSDVKSPRFINGVLDKLAKSKNGDANISASPETDDG